jgi:GT2 family glycosyltransferase
MDKRPAFHEELCNQYLYEQTGVQEQKDILVIVHDQLDYVKKCIASLYENTKNFVLYIWDNNSLPPTKEYLEEVARTNDNVVLKRHSENVGFIVPNNELAKLGNSPYVILLNSDTEVRKGWDTALIGWLKNNQKCVQVGYEGGLLEPDGRGNGKSWCGNTVDYVCGWCFCISRETYNQHGLFDENNLSFAYGEDSDFSLRLKEAGHDIYAMHIKLVRHYGNVTAKEVQSEMDTSLSFDANHIYIRNRHAHYLANHRMLKAAP